ncbi:EF-hand domain-containing protein [Oharaeibacter diazotrophicus]|uniref:EF hand domain-containing protein n=1 Tax=Oharaeibacter diazotrophicus TaxID=1920512 RepID=A0A4V3CVJ2_9HYPH|nr:EF-hand domain-containing protein [Oharaeibacter diazotrophicus]TDP82678.1 EF hand domain-containing protein [Oharaeibacter diazotrophicus]BBE72560.1 transaldolase/EF-hand domain-containing protein [Pleomorphomonas sp. SM30]GLS76590.1 hypothetical protein GCM10007904_19270 [Oharaeibacter diazotrophicus]
MSYRFPIAALATLVATLALAPTAAVAADGRFARMFRAADTDGDGRVTRAEFLTARAAGFDRLDRDGDGIVDRGGATGRLVARRVAAMDADGDGLVTRAEFEAAPTPGFDRADGNGDGAVDAAELARLRE